MVQGPGDEVIERARSCQIDLCSHQLVKGWARECGEPLEASWIGTLAIGSLAGDVPVRFGGDQGALECCAKDCRAHWPSRRAAVVFGNRGVAVELRIHPRDGAGAGRRGEGVAGCRGWC